MTSSAKQSFSILLIEVFLYAGTYFKRHSDLESSKYHLPIIKDYLHCLMCMHIEYTKQITGRNEEKMPDLLSEQTTHFPQFL